MGLVTYYSGVHSSATECEKLSSSLRPSGYPKRLAVRFGLGLLVDEMYLFNEAVLNVE